MSSVEQDGFAIVPCVITRKTISRILEGLEHSNVHRTRAGIRNVLRIPDVRELATHEVLIKLAKRVLGEGATPFRATLFDKSAQSNWLVVWHQDTALPLRERRNVPGWGSWSVKEGVICAHAPASALQQVLAIRVHLDDSNDKNGPLRVLPATHKFGVLNDDEIHDLSSRIPANDCYVQAGGALLMRPLLVHASSKSKSDAPRRVLHIEYASSLALCGLKLAID